MSTTMNLAPQPDVAARPKFKKKYEHFIGGEWVAPSGGKYFDNISPIDGKVFIKGKLGFF